MNKRTISSLILGATIALAASSATVAAEYQGSALVLSDMTIDWNPEINLLNALLANTSGINVTSSKMITGNERYGQAVMNAGGITLGSGGPGGHSVDYTYPVNASNRNIMGASVYRNAGKCTEVNSVSRCGNNDDILAVLQTVNTNVTLHTSNIIDTNLLTFSFTLDDKTLDTVLTSFIFATDETARIKYNTGLSDIFVFWVDDVNYALLPNGKIVTAMTAMDYYIDGSDYGFLSRTPEIGIEAKLDMSRDVHTITIAVADYSDGFYDSSVFIGGLKFTSTVPEPETYAMMLAGLAMVGAVARRRRKNA